MYSYTIKYMWCVWQNPGISRKMKIFRKVENVKKSNFHKKTFDPRMQSKMCLSLLTNDQMTKHHVNSWYLAVWSNLRNPGISWPHDFLKTSFWDLLTLKRSAETNLQPIWAILVSKDAENYIKFRDAQVRKKSFRLMPGFCHTLHICKHVQFLEISCKAEFSLDFEETWQDGWFSRELEQSVL